MPKTIGEKIICQNKKAYHDYFIIEEYECGIVLTGTEIKSVRLGHVNLQDSYCQIKNGEMFIEGMHISKYDLGNIFNHDPERVRKLLLHRKEILKLHGHVSREGYTLVPLAVYIENGLCKVELALAKGKKLFDKRETLKEKSIKHDQERYFKER